MAPRTITSTTLHLSIPATSYIQLQGDGSFLQPRRVGVWPPRRVTLMLWNSDWTPANVIANDDGALKGVLKAKVNA